VLRPGMNVEATVVTKELICDPQRAKRAKTETNVERLLAKLKMPDGSIKPWVIAGTVTLSRSWKCGHIDANVARRTLSEACSRERTNRRG